MSKNKVLGLLAFIVVTFWLLDRCRADEAKLYKTLFKNYTKEVRPVKKAAHAVNVTLDFDLRTIINLDSVEEVLYFVGFIKAEWRDEYLTWVPAEHGDIETLTVPPSKVWLPDFGIENSADSFYKRSFTSDFRVKINSEGEITWSFGGSFATLCSLSMALYPFDKQKCELLVENMAYNGNQVILTHKTKQISKPGYVEHHIWALEETKVRKKEGKVKKEGGEIKKKDIESVGPVNVPPLQVQFMLRLRRKPKYYIITIVGPCFLIIAVALSVFWMPPDTGEKISLGVTVLIAFSVLQIVIAGDTPQTSDSCPLLSDLVLSTMCLSTISILSSIIVLYLHYHNAKTRPPRLVRKLMFQYVARFLCLRSLVPEEESDAAAGEEAMMLEKSIKVQGSAHGGNETEKEILVHLKKITSKVRKDRQDEKTMDEWKGIATILDRSLFWFSLILITGLCVWILLQSDDASFED